MDDDSRIKKSEQENNSGDALKKVAINIHASEYLQSQVALDQARVNLKQAKDAGRDVAEAALVLRPLYKQALTKKQTWLESQIEYDQKIVGDILTDRDVLGAIDSDGKFVPDVNSQVRLAIEKRKGRQELWQVRLASANSENYKQRLYNAYEIAQAKLESRSHQISSKIAREMVDRRLLQAGGNVQQVVSELRDELDERKAIEMRKGQLKDELDELADTKAKLGISTGGQIAVPSAVELPIAEKPREVRKGDPYDFSIHEVTDEERDTILAMTEVHGDPFQDKNLTPEMLKEIGLSPKYKIEGTEGNVWLSSSGYKLDSGRIAVVGYVEYQGKTIARTFYRSNSQGVWRYLPNYRMAGSQVEWYGKGYGEESITLPIPLQKVLSEITSDESKIQTIPNPWLVFAGTARDSHSKNTYRREVNSTPLELMGNFYPPAPFDKVKPTELSFQSDQQTPDFSQKVTSWTAKTSLNGDITIDVFRSKDKSLGYMFCKDRPGRCWIGGIDTEGEIQSTGLHKMWINAGDLATPSYEYKTPTADQTGGYGNERMRNGPYLDMYTNYLSQIPVIQEYVISEAKTIEELFGVLDQLKQIPTSLGVMTSSELKSAISLIGTRGVDGKIIGETVVTSARGLRQKVIRLLNL